jgi:hypothetical protein
MLDRDSNDIFVIEETLELLEDTGISRNFIDLLRDGFQSRDYLILRWMPMPPR